MSSAKPVTGFVLMRQEAAGQRGATTYAVIMG